ncbi:hypothetical protein RJ641_017712, partial [Dillenia turbinata]
MKKQLYKVHVKKVEGDFYFIDGWEEFVNDQPIKLGDFLVFKYNRHAVFDVKIFGTNGCKKKLRVDSEEPSESEEAVDGTNRLKAKEPVPMETEVVSISDGEGKENGKEEEENGVEKVKKEEEEDDGVEEQGVQFDKRGTGVQKRKFNSTLFSDDVPRVTGATIHFLSSVAPVRTSLLVRLLVTDDHQIAEGPWVCPTVPYARSMKAAEITDEQYELLREAGIVIPRCPHFLVPSYENVRKNQLDVFVSLVEKIRLIDSDSAALYDSNRDPHQLLQSYEGQASLCSYPFCFLIDAASSSYSAVLCIWTMKLIFRSIGLVADRPNRKVLLAQALRDLYCFPTSSGKLGLDLIARLQVTAIVIIFLNF